MQAPMKRYFITIIHVFLNFTEDQIVIKIILSLFSLPPSPLSFITSVEFLRQWPCRKNKVMLHRTFYFRPRYKEGTPKGKFPRNFLVNRNDLWRILELSKLKTTFSFQDSCQTIWGIQHKIYYKWNCIGFIIIWRFNLFHTTNSTAIFASTQTLLNLPWRLVKSDKL